jgi:hypothetical protein
VRLGDREGKGGRAGVPRETREEGVTAGPLEIAQLASVDGIIFLGGSVANSLEIAHLVGFFWSYLS